MCQLVTSRLPVGEVHSLRMQSPGSGHNNAIAVLYTYVGNRGRKQMGGGGHSDGAKHPQGGSEAGDQHPAENYAGFSYPEGQDT